VVRSIEAPSDARARIHCANTCMVSYAANVKKNTTPIREHWQYGDDRHAATRLPFTGAMEGRFSSAAAGGPCDASSGDLDSPWVARDEPVERFIPFPVASIPSRQ
jgi:hypothetical protein